MAKFTNKIRRLRKKLWKVAEAEAAAGFTVTFRYGHLKRLPQEYVGERHTVIGKHLGIRGGQEWVEYEEVPGPAPKPVSTSANASRFPTAKAHIFDVVFVAPYPRAGQEAREWPEDEPDCSELWL